MIRFPKRPRALIPAIAVAAVIAAFGWGLQATDAQQRIRIPNPQHEFVYPMHEKLRKPGELEAEMPTI